MIEQEHSWRIGVRMQMRDVATWSTTGQLQISVDCNTTIMTLSGAEKEQKKPSSTQFGTMFCVKQLGYYKC
jgi:hypothetical protein